MPTELERVLAAAREVSWAEHGRRLGVYLPGMFVAYGRRGRYPAVSLTGSRCALGCDHCAGRLLEPMLPATTPQDLLSLGRELWQRGERGILLSGGSDSSGRLPWKRFIEAIAALSAETGLTITAHVGRIDQATAGALKRAGVRQALIDVVGEADTARRVLHLPGGLAAQEETLAACGAVGLELAPHLILGLHRGRMLGEWRALERLARLKVRRVVFVIFMPLKGTPLESARPVGVEEAARFMAEARQVLPKARHHLGCARPRGRYRAQLDRLAVAAGINALALPSDAALQAAAELGIEVVNHDVCCSLDGEVP